MHDLEETIVAVATPPGRGGIGCVRLSGPRAHAIASGLFRSREGTGAGPIRFGHFLDREGTPVDHGYLVRFEPGRSFTGEPTAELWAHGSPPVLDALLESAMAAGARAAGPGEFTYRALRRGRLDLARAEAVRDLVAARTRWQARAAFAQAEGSLSRRLAPLRDALVDLTVRAEAAVEFVDESETEWASAEFGRALDGAAERAAELLRAFRAGTRIRDGAVVTLTGLPNVGKSSLFNALLARDRAIVSEAPGTTRDTLEDAVDLDGIPVRVVDTAGLRPVDDPVESEGVRRARAARAEADLALLVLDGSRDLAEAEREALREIEGEDALVVVNKSDLPQECRVPFADAIRVSARTGEGLDSLRRRLRDRILSGEPLEDAVLADARHRRSLERCVSSLERGRAAFRAGLSEEAILDDVRESLLDLGEITGEFGTEELLERVFSTFCIGK